MAHTKQDIMKIPYVQYPTAATLTTAFPAWCHDGSTPPVWEIPLASIRLDGGTQARIAIATLVVDEYAAAMQTGAIFPPIIVFRDSDAFWLADGFHRVYAARQIGKATIAATIHPGTRRDAVLYAVGANARHGLRRTNADKRRAVLLLLDDPQWRQWSDREIARRCAVSNDFVSKIRRSICHSMTDDTVRYAARGDTVYPIQTGKIGKGTEPPFDALTALTPDVRMVLRDSPWLDQQVEMTALAQITDPAVQLQVASRLLDGTAQTVREAVRQLAHADKRVLTLQEVVTGKYPVIYADPPWQYSNARLGGAAAAHYPTMDTTMLCALPLTEYTTTNAVLFLWATNPMLPDALQVMTAWGFRYATNLAWVKDRPTYGKLAFYVRGQHELLLIGVKGSCLPKAGTLPVSVLTAAKGRHSEKPDDVYALIAQMFDGPYLELFARQQRPGWTAFGNEVREHGTPYRGAPATHAHRPLHVLLVEDDADLRDLFSLVLSVAGCQVTALADVTTAQRMLAGTAFDILITDYTLPDGTGTTLIQQHGAAMATILMSARAEIEATAASCGADGWFWKGHDLSRLVALVTALCDTAAEGDASAGNQG